MDAVLKLAMVSIPASRLRFGYIMQAGIPDILATDLPSLWICICRSV
jgi:hypothetical protein